MNNQPLTSPWVLTNKRGMRFIITDQPKVLGRAPSSDFVVDCTTVSRVHARIHREMTNGKPVVLIEDLESRNGTYIGDRKINLDRAGLGDVVRFGQVAFVIGEATYLDEQSTNDAESQFRALSPAQCRVFHELLNGISEKDIAQKLGLSPHTVHNHVREIYARFHVHSRAELLAQCLVDEKAKETSPDP